MYRRHLPGLVAGLLVLAAALPAAAQDDWPKRPVHVILPAGPGGTSDTLMRILSERLTRSLGQPIVLDHKPGAGGTLAATAVAQAEPDGYTLMMNSVATHAIGPSMYKLKFDPEKNVTGIAHVAFSSNVLYVRKDAPFRSVAELIAFARANPKKLNYASSGSGTSVHLSAVQFGLTAGIDAVHIPYTGAAPALQAVLAGDAAFSFENLLAMMGQIRGGTVTPLAVTTSVRSPQLPELPTIAESGLPGFNSSTWFGIVGPGGLPRPIVDKLAAALKSALDDPQVSELVRKLGAEPQFMAPRAFDDFMKSERVKWDATVKASGAKVG